MKHIITSLDERIETDLRDLRQRGEIDNAKQLSESLVAVANGNSDSVRLSTKGLPQYFVGDPDSKTVLVMLNPGGHWDKNDRRYGCDTCKLDRRTLASFVTSYKNAKKWFGEIDQLRHDEFDVRQAAFLSPWRSSGIALPSGFPPRRNAIDGREMNLAAKKAVLTGKLQLELIPYCSRRFDLKVLKRLSESDLRAQVFPLLETLLAEILRKSRKYVVFCGDAFDWLFQQYEGPFAFLGLDADCSPKQFSFGKVRCKAIVISDSRKGKNHRRQRALIAHTYPWRKFINNHDRMLVYGRFCYQTFESRRKS